MSASFITNRSFTSLPDRESRPAFFHVHFSLDFVSDQLAAIVEGKSGIGAPVDVLHFNSHATGAEVAKFNIR